MINTPEYQEGERANTEGKTTRDNPYNVNSEKHWLWQEGLLGNGKQGRNLDECSTLAKLTIAN